MKLLVLLLSELAQYRANYRHAVHCLRSRHSMLRMTDGPVCDICGFSWLWKDRDLWD